jgi:predicted DsbA family dithiol-disulfide isomerase
MSRKIEVYYDYTCGDAFRFKKLLDLVDDGVVEVDWKAYSLQEHNRSPSEPSVFERGLESFSLLALAIAQAVPKEGFTKYHDEVFDAVKMQKKKMTSDELFQLAETAGLDRSSFEVQRKKWLEVIVGQHTDGRDRWRSLGTPTVVFEGERAVYIELSDIPESRERANQVWSDITTIVTERPEIRELKRSV